MSLGKSGLKAFVLCVMAALGLIAFNTSAAQAKWLESGALLGNVLKDATGEVDLLGVFEIPALKVEIDCTEFDVKQGVILGNGHANGSNVAHLELLYKTCDAYTWSVEHAATKIKLDLLIDGPCELYETSLDREMSEHEGNLLAKGLATAFLEQTVLQKEMGESGTGEPFIEVVGTLEAGAVIARIWTRNCLALPNGTKVTGLVWFDLHEGALTNRVKQLVRVADLTLFPNSLRYGLNEALLLGSIWVKLLSGNTWGIC